MVGMIQVLTYLLAIYLVLKGFEMLMLALCCTRPDRERARLIVLGIVVAIGCGVAAFLIVVAQEIQAHSIGGGS